MKNFFFVFIQLTCYLLFFIPDLHSQPASSSLDIVARYAKNKGNNEEKILISLEPRVKSSKSKKETKHTVEMKGRKFLPRYLTINKGDTIAYLNRDNFDHNVFSLSKGSRFDLGSFPLDQKGEYVFQTPGVVKIYCNVHSEMASFVLVSESDWVKTASQNESFKFEQIPPGEYLLYAWSVRGEYQKQISITSGVNQPIEIVIEEVGNEFQHLNKFGKPYEDQEDEELY